MNKRGASVGEIVMIFVAVIFGIAMLTQVINTQSIVTNLQSVTDESVDLGAGCYAFNISGTELWEVNESDPDCNITVSQWYSDWRASEPQCYLSGVVVTNSTGTLTLTEDTDYIVHESEGIIQFLNTAKTNSNSLKDNVTKIDYNYCGEGYNKDSSSRSIAKLWGVFGALIIAAAALYGIRRWF